jgi:hypothetical protein
MLLEIVLSNGFIKTIYKNKIIKSFKKKKNIYIYIYIYIYREREREREQNKKEQIYRTRSASFVKTMIKFIISLNILDR